MRSILAGLLIATVVACGGRQVEVRCGPRPASEVSVRVQNNLSQGVNVYVVSGGQDMFLRQVNANSTETLPVQGVASGSSVTLRATTVDGRNTYTRDNVVLNGTFSWTVP